MENQTVCVEMLRERSFERCHSDKEENEAFRYSVCYRMALCDQGEEMNWKPRASTEQSHDGLVPITLLLYVREQ